jgi:S1-C subfamily serine protease
MAQQDLVDFIHQARIEKKSDTEIKKILIDTGWSEVLVMEAFEAAAEKKSMIAPIKEAASGEKEALVSLSQDDKEVLLMSEKVRQLKNVFLILALVLVLAGAGGAGYYYFIRDNGLSRFPDIRSLFTSKFSEGVPYTKNPALAILPMESVVKIITNKDTDQEGSGSGLLFTNDGYILTNAHVVNTPIGKPAKKITVCYSTSNNQDIACEFEAKVADSSTEYDLAIVKVDPAIIKKIRPYLLVVESDDTELFDKTVPIGSALEAIGYPGVGGRSITVTKGVVGGYRTEEVFDDKGSMRKIPYFIKTDTEINYGNSGGAVFDEKNRYIGIPTEMRKDDGGKLGLIIGWNKINQYLVETALSGALTLNEEQYIDANTLLKDSDFRLGVAARVKKDYARAAQIFELYTEKHPDSVEGWYQLCAARFSNKEKKEVAKNIECADRLRSLNPDADALYAYVASFSDVESSENNEKSYASLTEPLKKYPESTHLLMRKAYLEFMLKKKDATEETLKKVLRLDEINYLAYRIAGLMAMEKNENLAAATILEASFPRDPDADIASLLSDLYMKLGVGEESLRYQVYAIMLDPKRIDNILKLNTNIMASMPESASDQFSENLKEIKKILESVNLDKEFIDSVAAITDKEIESFIKENAIKNPAFSLLGVSGIRNMIKMSLGGLYAYHGDQTECKNQYISLNLPKEKIAELYATIGAKREVIFLVLVAHYMQECLCYNYSQTQDVMDQCLEQKLRELGQ